MKIFINDTAVLNYPLADQQDVGPVQSMLTDMSIVSSTPVYMTAMWSDGVTAGGLLTNGASGEDPCGHFSGAIQDGSLSIYTDKAEPIGWVVLGPEITRETHCTGHWLVNQTCVIAPTAVHTFSVNGINRTYPNVLRIVPTDYIQISTEGTIVERTPFANTQDLDARDWDIDGPLLSINGQKTTTGDCTVNLHVTASYTAGRITVEDTDNFLCTGTYSTRDNAIMDHADYGLSMELPLDNMVRVWKGVCPRRSVS